MFFKLFCFMALFISLSARPIKNLESLKQFLHQYGYSQKEDPSQVELEDAIKKLQGFYKLKVTGNADDDLTPFVEGSRCGMKDIVANGNDGSPLAFTLGPTWTSKNLRYRLENYPKRGRIPKANVKEIMNRALQRWEDAVTSGFSIREATRTETSQLNLKFASYDHRDGAPFDGPGKVLAHAFFPQSGQVHFDDSETWSETFSENINLEWVAIHEFGHALGLGHSAELSAIMYPYYRASGPNVLDADDIAGINALYP